MEKSEFDLQNLYMPELYETIWILPVSFKYLGISSNDLTLRV